ncbi:DNA polymerase I [Candidatus Terasakiella magnetica]|uniref:DNA polymerase I n=1 Tax=Candidatus Terasakiella magnetica TaxID=1867952 RepID=A0A1C3RE03_9PROT|nr:DNA polymerase I [Candidatus Terasakiella magnetica]SCA55461.1 DNA polymerase I [Candidatus Terasakiella magnetica]
MTDTTTQTAKPEHVYLIDGSSFIFRAYFANMRNPMTRSDGTPVGAVYGFCSMLMKLLSDTDADHVAVVFDTARKTFRNDVYPEYKAHRPPPPDDLIPQFDLVREAVEAFNVARVEMAGYEADDLIATYAKQASKMGSDVTIVSIDKDLMQLVDDHICMYDTMKNRIIKHDEVVEKFGVGPERVIDVQALAGDSSDNVPGVEGIGPKTAALLINEYGDLETLLERASEIKQNKRRERLIEQAEMARVSKELVTLCQDVPIDVPLSDFANQQFDAEKLINFFEEQGFKSLITRVASKFGVDVAQDEGGATERKDGEVALPSMAELCPKETKYELVQDEATLARWIEAARLKGTVAVDTETDSLDALSATLVGVSLSYEVGKACYIPLRHKSAQAAQTSLFGDDEGPSDAPVQVSFDKATSLIKSLLEDETVLKVGQNIKYDMLVLANPENGGMKVTPIDDTMVLSYINEGSQHGHGMDELSELHFGHKPIPFKEVCGTGKKQITFDLVELEKARDYAAEDADITLRLHQLLKPQLVGNKNTTLYETMERPLISVLALIEGNGIKVDVQELRAISDEFALRLAELEKEIHALAGKEFNIGSPKQLGEVMFDDLELPGGKKGKTGAYQTGVGVLEKLVDAGHELPVKVMEWRQLSKLKSTYADALISQVNAKTGRVHTSFQQAVTSTGRLSSSDPNLQNIPIRTQEGRRIRRAFVADEGKVLMAADYSQIELRLLAHVAEIDSLKEAFLKGIDIHALTASQVFGVPVEGMDPMVRRNAKAINFGIIYGQSQYGLAKQLGISNGEAKDYIEAYFEQYPGIRTFMEEAKDEARDKGYVTTFMGRKCFIPGINDKNGARRAYGERAAINAPIQGGAADIIKRAMVGLPEALNKAGLSSLVLLQVHDELVLEVLPDEVEKTKEVLKEVMEGAAQLSVPLVVDIGVGNNWEEAH